MGGGEPRGHHADTGTSSPPTSTSKEPCSDGAPRQHTCSLADAAAAVDGWVDGWVRAAAGCERATEESAARREMPTPPSNPLGHAANASAALRYSERAITADSRDPDDTLPFLLVYIARHGLTAPSLEPL